MSFGLIHGGSRFLALLLNAALRSLLFACFVGGILAVFRVRSVRHKLIAWRAALVLALAMPLLLLQIPHLPLPVPLGGVEGTAHAAMSAAPLIAPPARVAAAMPQRFLPNERARRKSSAPVTPAATEQTYAGVSVSSRRMFSWPLAGLLMELAVASMMLARVLIGVYFANRLLRTSLRIDDPESVNLLARICHAVGAAKIPRLLESAIVRVPVTLGINDPAILLPIGWREWQGDELAAVLAHEASHVARQDALVQRLALIHRAIFWFSPLSWWLNCHLAELAEQASDEAALGAGADRARYAETLLGFFAELDAAPARVWWQGVAMAKAGQSEKRVERILAWRSAMSNRISKSLAVAIVAICAPVAVLTVSATPSPYSAQELAGPPAPQPPPPPSQFAAPVAPEQSPAPTAMPAAPSAEIPGEPPEIASPSAVPVLPSEPAAITMPAPKPQAPSQSAVPAPTAITPPAGDWTGFNYWGWGPRFVIVSNGAQIVNGTEEDAELARALRSKVHGDFIWFEQDGKSYIIRDQTIIDRARKIWAPRGDSAKLQRQLQEKERALSEQMHEQVQQKMQEIRVKVPDMTAELEKLQSELKTLNSNGATLQQLGDLQREVGELQQALNQARWNSNMQEITRRAGELGQQMGELGRQIGEIARQQVEAGQRAGAQMRQLFDDAIASGAAKPE
jgi:bla regulator protein blaR1